MSLVGLIPRTTFQQTLRFFSPHTRAFAHAHKHTHIHVPIDAASACPAGTVMTGLNYLKGESPVLAKPDEEYPSWLWDLLKPRRTLSDGVDDEPGGKAEKRRLRLQHRQALKDSNLFKSK